MRLERWPSIRKVGFAKSPCDEHVHSEAVEPRPGRKLPKRLNSICLDRFHVKVFAQRGRRKLRVDVEPKFVKIWAEKEPAFSRKNSVLEKVQGPESRSRSVLERISEARVIIENAVLVKA